LSSLVQSRKYAAMPRACVGALNFGERVPEPPCGGCVTGMASRRYWPAVLARGTGRRYW
jgi:hypothetical protein